MFHCSKHNVGIAWQLVLMWTCPLTNKKTPKSFDCKKMALSKMNLTLQTSEDHYYLMFCTFNFQIAPCIQILFQVQQLLVRGHFCWSGDTFALWTNRIPRLQSHDTCARWRLCWTFTVYMDFSAKLSAKYHRNYIFLKR